MIYPNTVKFITVYCIIGQTITSKNTHKNPPYNIIQKQLNKLINQTHGVIIEFRSTISSKCQDSQQKIKIKKEEVSKIILSACKSHEEVLKSEELIIAIVQRNRIGSLVGLEFNVFAENLLQLAEGKLFDARRIFFFDGTDLNSYSSNEIENKVLQTYWHGQRDVRTRLKMDSKSIAAFLKLALRKYFPFWSTNFLHKVYFYGTKDEFTAHKQRIKQIIISWQPESLQPLFIYLTPHSNPNQIKDMIKDTLIDSNSVAICRTDIKVMNPNVTNSTILEKSTDFCLQSYFKQFQTKNIPHSAINFAFIDQSKNNENDLLQSWKSLFQIISFNFQYQKKFDSSMLNYLMQRFLKNKQR